MDTFLNKGTETKHNWKPFKVSQVYFFLEYFIWDSYTAYFFMYLPFYCALVERLSEQKQAPALTVGTRLSLASKKVDLIS